MTPAERNSTGDPWGWSGSRGPRRLLQGAPLPCVGVRNDTGIGLGPGSVHSGELAGEAGGRTHPRPVKGSLWRGRSSHRAVTRPFLWEPVQENSTLMRSLIWLLRPSHGCPCSFINGLPPCPPAPEAPEPDTETQGVGCEQPRHPGSVRRLARPDLSHGPCPPRTAETKAP